MENTNEAVAPVETPVAQEPKTETISEALKTAVPSTKEPEVVGLDKFLELKKQNKELKRSYQDLERRITEGESVKEVTPDLQALAEEHNVDIGFLQKLAKNIENKAQKDIDERIEARLAPITQREQAEFIDKQFNTHFGAAMESLPDYKDIVNPEVIKTLSLDPKNGKKTFAQLIEETYGNAITGRRTIETTKPGGGKEPEEVDIARAQKDGDYFKEIMADPKKKAEYNKGMTTRLNKFL